MRRTLERSQRVEQRQKRWSWGGLSDSDNKNGTRACSESQTWETPVATRFVLIYFLPKNLLMCAGMTCKTINVDVCFGCALLRD